MKTFSCFIIFLTSCINAQPQFGERIDKGLIQHDELTEASGIAASRKNADILWSHNDRGNDERVFAFDINGNNIGEFYLNDVSSRDWEDIAVGPGPEEEKSYIYVGNIGDNDQKYNRKFIYRFEEPEIDFNNIPVNDTVIVDEITFKYPDEISYDSETLMIDPLTKDIYIVTKKEEKVILFLAPYPQSIEKTITLQQVMELNFTGAVAGDISGDGSEIIIKTENNIFYWKRNNDQTIAEALSVQPFILPYIVEPQGEAVCWASDGSGYYTLSEEENNIEAHLYFYPRIATSVEENDNLITDFLLEQNYPNPFNPTTKISWQSSVSSWHTLKVYDILGNEVATLVNEEKSPGIYEIIFDADKYGLSSGTYFYRLTAGSFSSNKKFILLK